MTMLDPELFNRVVCGVDGGRRTADRGRSYPARKNLQDLPGHAAMIGFDRPGRATADRDFPGTAALGSR